MLIVVCLFAFLIKLFSYLLSNSLRYPGAPFLLQAAATGSNFITDP